MNERKKTTSGERFLSRGNNKGKDSKGFPCDSDGKEPTCNAGSIPGSGRSPGEGNGNPAPVFQPVESHGQTSLVGYSPWGRKELDTTE